MSSPFVLQAFSCQFYFYETLNCSCYFSLFIIFPFQRNFVSDYLEGRNKYYAVDKRYEIFTFTKQHIINECKQLWFTITGLELFKRLTLF